MSTRTKQQRKTKKSSSKNPPFYDKEDKLIAIKSSKSIIKSMLDEAEQKGWETISLTGDREFKKESWLTAKMQGFDVEGYTPTQKDQKELIRLKSLERSISKAPEPSHEKTLNIETSDNSFSNHNNDEQEEKINNKSRFYLAPIFSAGKNVFSNFPKITVKSADNETPISESKEHKENIINDSEPTQEDTLPKEKSSGLENNLDKNYIITTKGRKTTYSYINDPSRVAFTEKGERFVTKEKNISLIKNILDLAEQKGWETISVTGDKDFKRDTWLEAKARGLEVIGYTPTEQDKRKLEMILSRENSISKNDVDAKKETTNKKPTLKELKNAFYTKTKKMALESYPELKAVYAAEKSATDFFKSKGGLEKQEAHFKKLVTDKAITELSKGNEVPKFVPVAYTPKVKTTVSPKNESSQMEVEID